LRHAPVKGFMSTEVVTVGAEAAWDEVQRVMVQNDIGRLPVVEDEKVVGIISRSDVLRLVHGAAIPMETQLVRERSAAMRQDILNLIEKLPERIKKLLNAVRDTAQEEECPVYLVGGFVRDLLLSFPTQDLDFVVEGNGGRFAEALMNRLQEGKLTLHVKFGTAQITFPDGSHLDVASTRLEYYSYPGALPQVEESCLRDDLFRRDFTINSMAICLNSQRFGELVDYYGGKRDLQQGKIRFLHNISFIDDPTRMLRAIRFAERYHFNLAKETLEALYTAIQTDVLTKLSAERFTEELMLIYKEPNYLAMGRMLINCGLFKAWFGENYAWNFNLINGEDCSDWPLNKRWLVSVSKINSDLLKKLMERLSLNKSLRDDTLCFIHLRNALKDSLSLIETDRLINKAPKEVVMVLARDERYNKCIKECIEASQRINMSIDGNTLLKMGVKEGPKVGGILDQVRLAWLEGRVSNSEEEKAMVCELVKVLQ